MGHLANGAVYRASIQDHQKPESRRLHSAMTAAGLFHGVGWLPAEVAFTAVALKESAPRSRSFPLLVDPLLLEGPMEVVVVCL